MSNVEDKIKELLEASMQEATAPLVVRVLPLNQ